MADVVARSEFSLLADLAHEGALTTTALTLDPATSYETWAALGVLLGRFSHASCWAIGDWLEFGERAYGEKYAQAAEDTGLLPGTLTVYSWVCRQIPPERRRAGLSFLHHRVVAPLDPAEQDDRLEQAETNGWTVAQLRSNLDSNLDSPPPLPEGEYRCIVIDPPWPMEKIDRDLYPSQGRLLDYAVMSLEEIDALVGEVVTAQSDCHVYLWVTHRFLPDGLRLFESWGVAYQCVMTWVKNVGFTPFSWMYDTEHVLFGRRGSLTLDQLGLRLSFSAPVTHHSEKPDVFYERVMAASPEPRLDMFARRRHKGFKAWGAEVAA